MLHESKCDNRKWFGPKSYLGQFGIWYYGTTLSRFHELHFFETLFNIFMSERVISFVKLLRDSLCNQVPTKAPHLESGMNKILLLLSDNLRII